MIGAIFCHAVSNLLWISDIARSMVLGSQGCFGCRTTCRGTLARDGDAHLKLPARFASGNDGWAKHAKDKNGRFRHFVSGCGGNIPEWDGLFQFEKPVAAQLEQQQE